MNISKKVVIIKAVILFVIIIGSSIVLNAYEPVFSANIAVQQASDTIDSSANIKIYNQFKQFAPLAWIAIGLLLYSKEIKNTFKNKNEKVEK